MKIIKISVVLFTLIFSFVNQSCSKKDNHLNIEEMMSFALKQVSNTLDGQQDFDQIPRHIPQGQQSWETQKYHTWTSGFWPGILWLIYDYTNDSTWKNLAHERSLPVANILTGDRKDHDLGFQFYCSFGNGYRLTGNNEYKNYLLTAADQLAAMYHPVVGTILSWPHAIDRYEAPHNTIIDNLMNLELLFWAAKNGGSQEHYNIALNHATVTLKNQIRPDYTHWHVVAYDTITGNAVQKVTRQGYSDESLWARGQAWGIYGFTMVYRETGQEKFMEAAKQMSKVFIDRLPEDFVPYWDFDAPDIPDAPRDASAAAVAASGLLELSDLVANEKESEYYYSVATEILKSLSESYTSDGSNHAILEQSVGNFNRDSEVDVPIIYADYYFLEALLRKSAIDS